MAREYVPDAAERGESSSSRDARGTPAAAAAPEERRTGGPRHRAREDAFSRPAWLSPAFAVLWVGVAAYLAYGLLLPHEGTASIVFRDWLYNLVGIGVPALCLARVLLVPVERGAWLAFTVATGAWAGGNAAWPVVVSGLDPIPAPSVADFFWLAFYPAAFAGLMLLIRRRLHRLPASLWLDGLVACLTFAAFGAAFLVTPIVDATGGATAVVATALAYPVSDAVLLAVVAVLLAASGWRPSRGMALIGAALLTQIVVDSVYAYQAAVGTWRGNGLLDTGWLLVSVLIAHAAWTRPEPTREVGLRGGWVLAVPVVCGLALVGLHLYGDHLGAPELALAIASGGLIAAFLGTAEAARESHHLLELATHDPLTGLLNHREFHASLRRTLQGAAREGSVVSLMLFDLDGFKDVNDLRGHAEGDRLLRSCADAIVRLRRPDDVAGRLGGDEFGLILPGAGPTNAIAIGERVAQAVAGLDKGFGVSFGTASWPADGPSIEMLMLRADVALYAAKKHARAESAKAADGTEPEEAL
ncbi:MAG: GGDEF domain-containing protein [Thermoleophilaceae bacterium]|nr:GGDEF domain-containing protein [Thermoleophilaceae bacterium]